MFMGHNPDDLKVEIDVQEIEMEFVIEKAAAGHGLPRSQKAKDERTA